MFFTELSANDCFDYFVNNFESLYKNESKYKTSTYLDSDITNNNLYQNLCDNYLSQILNQEEFKDFVVTFERGLNGIRDFINAIFYDPINDNYIAVEFNRNEPTESITESFNRGLETVNREYAQAVYEIKMSNYS